MEEYRRFLSQAKTERECVSWLKRKAQAAGFVSLEERMESGAFIEPGERFYWEQRGKAMMLFVAGERPTTDGLRLIGAHVDSPRLDLKPHPLYESEGLAYLKTHYYGGIKKYQWLALPLALHGVVAKTDGSVVEICVGEDPEGPVLGISDLLVHLSAEQMSKTVANLVEGETLNAMIAMTPDENPDEEKEPIKKAVLALLEREYGITEEDFVSAELCLVPAGPARDYGLDRSCLMGYGHDDRSCAWACWAALERLEEVPEHTCVALWADKEEIGSVGASGMQSSYLEDAVAEFMALRGEEGSLNLRRALRASKALSADVSAAFDPNYPAPMEKTNSAFLGKGPCLNKYTGSRGKSGSNDADAEMIAWLRDVWTKAEVEWQIGELGKVDAGGGGTIAWILARLGMEVVDCGIPVHNMHAPWELISKSDLVETVRAYEAFYRT